MNTDRLYYRRKIAGLCPECGAEIDDKKFKLCSGCRKIGRLLYKIKRSEQTTEEREAFNKKRREYLWAKHEQGICIDCGAPSPVHWRCDACSKMAIDRYKKKTSTLRDKAKEVARE